MEILLQFGTGGQDRGTGETHGTFLLASGEIRTHAQPFKKSLVPALISLVVKISN